MSSSQRVLIVAILASFVAFLDGSVVNVALPAMTRELHGGLVMQQWVVDAYTLALGSLILVAGSFSDLFGRKKILSIGLVGFGIASLMCAIAPSSTLLIIARGLQGVAGALLIPSSLALIISSFSDAAQGRAIGRWTAWTGIAFVVGPLLGGALVDIYSWRLIFAINVLPIIVTLWLMIKIDEFPRPKRPRIDIRGLILCVIGLAGPVYALIEQARLGWRDPVIYGALLFGVAAFGAFVRQERRTTSPLLPFSLFAIRNFTFGNIATWCIYAVLALASFVITVFMQQVAGYSAVGAGLVLLPTTFMMFTFSGRFGILAGTYGSRIFMTVGPLMAAMGLLLMLRMTVPVHYWTQVFPGILLVGFGISMTVAPLTSAVLGSVSSQQAGIASAVNNAVSRIAGLVAIACVGLITGDTLTLVGFYRSIRVMAILLILGSFVSFAGIRKTTKVRE